MVDREVSGLGTVSAMSFRFESCYDPSFLAATCHAATDSLSSVDYHGMILGSSQTIGSVEEFQQSVQQGSGGLSSGLSLREAMVQ